MSERNRECYCVYSDTVEKRGQIIRKACNEGRQCNICQGCSRHCPSHVMIRDHIKVARRATVVSGEG
jgi:hypothetical protein